MAEGLKIVNEVYKRAVEQHDIPSDAFLGVVVTVLVLGDPQNADLWKRMVEYCGEEQQENREEKP